MLAPWNIITKLEETSSRLEKEQILKEAFESLPDHEFFNYLILCYDSLVTFGVKQIPEAKIFLAKELSKDFTESLEAPRMLDSRDFDISVPKLVKREATGHAARDLLQELADLYYPNAWNNWFRRILLKDLKCGCDVKTINKVRKSLNKSLIPVFECQLAQDSAKHESKLTGKKICQSKLDGIRVLSIIYPSGFVQQFSRNGKELLNFETVKEELAKLAPYIKEPVVLDGEVMSESFQDLMKQVFRKEQVQTKDATLYLFDFVPLKDFQEGIYSTKQEDRLVQLRALLLAGVAENNLDHIRMLEYTLVDLDTIEGQEQFKDINKKAVEAGFEGIMIKDIEAPYECKRTSSWLKLKPFIEVSLTVKGFEEGTGKNEGRLGALICEGVEDDKLIKVNIGGGFSDEQRDEFWKNKDSLLEHIVEVRADVITKNQDTKDESYSLRFPRFLRFRGFDKNEKI